jgi:hypothetical protein
LFSPGRAADVDLGGAAHAVSLHILGPGRNKSLMAGERGCAGKHALGFDSPLA